MADMMDTLKEWLTSGEDWGNYAATFARQYELEKASLQVENEGDLLKISDEKRFKDADFRDFLGKCDSNNDGYLDAGERKMVSDYIENYWISGVFSGADRFGNHDDSIVVDDDYLRSLVQQDAAEYAYGKSIADSMTNGNFDSSVLSEQTDKDIEDVWINLNLVRDSLENNGGNNCGSLAYTNYMISLCESELIGRGYSSDFLQSELDNKREILESEGISDIFRFGVDVTTIAAYNKTRADLIVKYWSLSNAEREITVGCKSDLLLVPTKGTGYPEHATVFPHDDKLPDLSQRWDAVEEGETKVLNGDLQKDSLKSLQCVITKNADGTMHCESEYLGSFDYDLDDWVIGYKEIPGTEDENGGEPVKLPVLTCVADIEFDPKMDAYGKKLDPEYFGDPYSYNDYLLSEAYSKTHVTVPKGAKCLDYSFAGNYNLQLMPDIPDSVESGHCAFAHCPNLIDTLHDGASLPDGMKDLSNICEGCARLGDVGVFSRIPRSAVTISGMIDGCTRCGAAYTNSWAFAIFGDCPFARFITGARAGKQLFNTEGCNDLVFADVLNGDLSEQMKSAVVEDNQKNEGRESSNEEGRAMKAADNTKTVLEAKDCVPDLDEYPIDSNDSTDSSKSIQDTVINIASVLGIKTVTGLFTDSKLLQWGAGLAGTMFLRSADKLPHSFVPLLESVSELLPDGAGKTVLSKICSWLGNSEKEHEAALEKQFDLYRPEALKASLESGAKHAIGGGTVEWMKKNGASIVEHGVMLDVGKDGYESASKVGDVIGLACKGMSDVFKGWEDVGYTGTNLKENIRNAVFNQIDGIEAYSGATEETIRNMYSGDEYDTAMKGLGHVDAQALNKLIPWIKAMNKEYDFLTEEDFERLRNLEVGGVKAVDLWPELKDGMESAGKEQKDAPEAPVEAPVEAKNGQKTGPSDTEGGKENTKYQQAVDRWGHKYDEDDQENQEDDYNVEAADNLRG